MVIQSNKREAPLSEVEQRHKTAKTENGTAKADKKTEDAAEYSQEDTDHSDVENLSEEQLKHTLRESRRKLKELTQNKKAKTQESEQDVRSRHSVPGSKENNGHTRQLNSVSQSSTENSGNSTDAEEQLPLSNTKQHFVSQNEQPFPQNSHGNVVPAQAWRPHHTGGQHYYGGTGRPAAPGDSQYSESGPPYTFNVLHQAPKAPSVEVKVQLGKSPKSVCMAYLLWFFLGAFAAHRFYLGKYFSAIIFLLTWVLAVSFSPLFAITGVWWLDGLTLGCQVASLNARSPSNIYIKND